MYVTAIVLAAGEGLRLKTKVPKPLVKINSKPLIIYSLSTLSKHPYIKDIIVVVNQRNLKDIRDKIKQYRIGKVRAMVLGGRLRQDSVFNGLKNMDSRTDTVLIHDAARPFAANKLVSSLIKAARAYGAAIAGVPVKATIKKIRSGNKKIKAVDKTIERNTLWEIHTPQVFKKDLILMAYEKFGNIGVTDDAMLVEKLKKNVRVVLGAYNNIKITTPDDLMIARAIAKGL